MVQNILRLLGKEKMLKMAASWRLFVAMRRNILKVIDSDRCCWNAWKLWCLKEPETDGIFYELLLILQYA